MKKGSGDRAHLCLVFPLLFVAGLAPLLAADTHVIEHKTAADFQKGESDNIFFDAEGGIGVAPKMEEILPSDEPFLFALEKDDAGNLYAATGNRGVVFMWKKNQKTPVSFILPDVAVMALERGGQGMFAAGFPSGEITLITPDGRSERYARLNVRYIWDLAWHKGKLYAATGEPACLYQVERGEGRPIFCARDNHFLSMAPSQEGFFLGSGGSARLYRVTLAGKASVLYTFAGEDVYRLVTHEGSLYLAVNARQGGAVGVEGPPPAQTKGNGGAQNEQTLGRTVSPIQSTKGAPTASLYRYRTGKLPELLLSVSDPVITSLALAADQLLVGTVNEGRLYRYRTTDDTLTILQLPVQQVLALYATGEEIYFSTGNPAAVWKINRSLPQEALYTSEVIDTEQPSVFGLLKLVAVEPEGTRATVEKRMGNTDIPDDTWTDWLPAGEISLTPARFAQYRLRLLSRKDQGPLVRQVQWFYHPLNQPPSILSVDISPVKQDPKGKSQKAGTSLEEFPVSSERTMKIAAEDPDDDTLTYDVFVRSYPEGLWLPFLTGMEKGEFNFTLADLPEGWHQFKVVVDDARSNSPGTSQKDELLTAPFIVDHTAPSIEARALVLKNEVLIKGKIRDDVSFVRRAEYYWEEEWNLLDPVDGVWDEPEEEIELTLKKPATGRHAVVIKAYDRVGNQASVWVHFAVP